MAEAVVIVARDLKHWEVGHQLVGALGHGLPGALSGHSGDVQARVLRDTCLALLSGHSASSEGFVDQPQLDLVVHTRMSSRVGARGNVEGFLSGETS